MTNPDPTQDGATPATDAPEQQLTAEGAPRAAHYDYVAGLAAQMPTFEVGDHVELIESDQWSNMIGRHGIVSAISGDPIDPGCQVLWDPPDQYFPGLSTLRSHFRKLDEQPEPPSA